MLTAYPAQRQCGPLAFLTEPRASPSPWHLKPRAASRNRPRGHRHLLCSSSAPPPPGTRCPSLCTGPHRCSQSSLTWSPHFWRCGWGDMQGCPTTARTCEGRGRFLESRRRIHLRFHLSSSLPGSHTPLYLCHPGNPYGNLTKQASLPPTYRRGHPGLGRWTRKHKVVEPVKGTRRMSRK